MILQMGHTTCCFLRVEGGSENEKHFMLEESDEKYPIQDLHKLGHALSGENSKLKNMGQDSLLRIFYPKSGSKLLQNDVVLLDRLVWTSAMRSRLCSLVFSNYRKTCNLNPGVYIFQSPRRGGLYYRGGGVYIIESSVVVKNIHSHRMFKFLFCTVQ